MKTFIIVLIAIATTVVVVHKNINSYPGTHNFLDAKAAEKALIKSKERVCDKLISLQNFVKSQGLDVPGVSEHYSFEKEVTASACAHVYYRELPDGY